MKETPREKPVLPLAAPPSRADMPCPGEAGRTNLFCPVCGHEFLPEEIGKKPHCRRCGYVES